MTKFISEIASAHTGKISLIKKSQVYTVDQILII